MAIPEIKIKSLGKLIDRGTPLESDPGIQRRRDYGIYRGVSDSTWPLLTSLDQLGGNNPPHMKSDLEEHILRNFIRYSRPYLTLMQRQQGRPDFACVIEPPSLDARIVAQCAAFTLCSDKEQSFDSFLKGPDLESVLTKLIVPAAEAARLRDQLNLAGLDERIIFSDLDGVAQRMRRYYS
jgi:hypothetical protein